MRVLQRIISINGTVLGPESEFSVVEVLGCRNCVAYVAERTSPEVVKSQRDGALGVEVRCSRGPLRGKSPCDANKNCSVE